MTKHLRAGISLGILDFSANARKSCRTLNKLGIPVTAWLAAAHEQGYWFNLGNYAEATARYHAFKSWSAENGLTWARVGLDIESNINEMQDFAEKPGAILRQALKRMRDTKAYHAAKIAYEALVAQIHADGYPVESYHFPLIVDERQARSTVLQRAAGLVDVAVDREVLMLYSSFFRPHGQAILWDYADKAQAIGIGNTGGGIQTGARGVPYRLGDFDGPAPGKAERQANLCFQPRRLWAGFCRVGTFDWQAEVNVPGTALISAGRGGLRGLLWLLERPAGMLTGLAGVLGAVLVIKFRGKSKKRNS